MGERSRGGRIAFDSGVATDERPVFDFRGVNSHVECHTGREIVDVCGETFMKRRKTVMVKP